MFLESPALDESSSSLSSLSYGQENIMNEIGDHHIPPLPLPPHHHINNDHHNLTNTKPTDKLVAAIDQGTSSSRFLVFSTETGELVTYHQIEIKKIYPNEGWVEQDPAEILSSVTRCIDVVAKKLPELGFQISDIRCVGLTNQRESTILWERTTGMLIMIIIHNN